MGNFVKEVFLKEAAKPLDSDGDGVYDNLDRCPNTPAGVNVDAQGCPLDTDGDGVYDCFDECPDTPGGAKVNEQGCWVLDGVLFYTNEWNIKPDFYPNLDAVVAVLEQNPDLKIKIRGHTDSTGNPAYNMKLSEKRAIAVMNYLVKRGIDPKRLFAEGFGLTLPIADNDTVEGRAKNRRVELQPIQ
jgi:OOP family OmpA-OmpF porin